ncbi:MAG: hypothetical protein QOC71_55 [Thermoplasmata archaeon]|nr:hypothetical protein [Thermoplasmata archaeon]
MGDAAVDGTGTPVGTPAGTPVGSPSAASVQPVHADDALHFPTLDGVRFLAYFAVFLSHTIPALRLSDASVAGWSTVVELSTSGGFGVDLFLVLSAFLITSLLMHEQDRLGTIRVRWFYVRRMLRIWPLYLAFLAAMFVASSVLPGSLGLHRLDPAYWITFLLLVGNWYTGLHGYPGSNISPLWSVSLEEQFYLLWPLVLLLLRRHLVKVCAGFIALSVVARLVVVMLGLSHPAMWTFTVTRLDPIALGALLAVGYRRGVLGRLSPATQWAMLIGGFASWPVAFWLMAGEQPPGLVAALVSFPLVALCATGILLAAVQGDGALRRFFLRRWIVRMGSLSYGTYVFHLLMVHAAQAALDGQSATVYNLLLLPLSFGLAWLAAEVSYRWLEAPFLRMRKRFRPTVSSAGAKDKPPTRAGQTVQGAAR